MSNSSAARLQRPPRFYGWVIVWVAFIVNALAGCLHPVVFSFFIGPMSESLGVSRGELSWGLTLRLVGAGVASPLLGWLIDRVGPRWLGTTAALLGGASIAAMGATDRIWLLYILFALSGMVGLSSGAGGGGLLTIVPVAKWFVARRNRAMAIAYAGTPLGIVAAIPLASWLIDAHGWRVGWVVFGIALAVVSTPLFALFMRRSPEDMGLNPDGVTNAAANRAQAVEERSWTLAQAARTPAFWLALVAFCCMALAINGTLVHRVQFWKELGIDPGIVAFATTLDPFAVFLSSLFFGIVAGHLQPRYLGLIGGGVMAAAMFPMIFAANQNYLVFLANIIWGTGAGAFIAVNNLLWPSFYGRRFLGSIRGVVLTFTIAAGGLSAPVYGYLLDAGVAPRAVWLTSLALFVAAALLFLASKAPRLQPAR